MNIVVENTKILSDGPDQTLEFKRETTLPEYAAAMKAYGKLIRALERREPLYPEFTAWLLKEGYVE